MATTTPWFAQNLPAGPDGYGMFMDFDRDTDEDQFIITRVGSSTEVISDAVYGEMLTTNAAADNDSTEYQWEAETIRFNGLGKTYWIFGRFSISDATQSDWVFGVAKTDTTMIAGVSDGVWFRKDDGDTNVDAVSAFNASSFPDDYTQTNGIATMDTSYHEYAIRVVTDATTLGTAVITYFVDGTPKTSITTTTLCHDEELALTFGIQNGEAVAKTMNTDYVGWWVPNVR